MPPAEGFGLYPLIPIAPTNPSPTLNPSYHPSPSPISSNPSFATHPPPLPADRATDAGEATISLMASPAPSYPPSPDLRPNSSELNYFVASVAAVALLLLLYNAIAVGWCARYCPLWGWSRRSPRGQGEAAARSSQIAGTIPAHKYRKEDAAGEKGGGSDESQCAVCLSAFVEGEDLRRLPKCGHSFHAACIDLWLCSHASCPLCRASVLAAPPPPQTSPVPVAGALEEDPARLQHARGFGGSAPNPALIMALV